MAFNPALRKMIDDAKAKHKSPTIIDQMKSDLSELMPELEMWPEALRHTQPVPVDTLTAAISLYDEARKLKSDLERLTSATELVIAEAYLERVRGLERAHSHLHPHVWAEVSKSVEWLDINGK